MTIMASTGSKYHERNARKSSWLPLLAAIVLPTIGFMGLKAFQAYNASLPPPQSSVAGAAPQDDQFYLTVRLVLPDGSPAAGRQITFTHQGPGADGAMTTRTTDSAGIATLTTPTTGSILVQMDGRREPARIKDLQEGARTRTVEFEIGNETAP